MPHMMSGESESARKNRRMYSDWTIYPGYSAALESGVPKLEAIVPGYLITGFKDQMPPGHDPDGDGKYHLLVEIKLPEGSTENQKILAGLVIQQIQREAWSD